MCFALIALGFRVQLTRRALLALRFRVHFFHLTLLTLLIRVKIYASFALLALGLRVHFFHLTLLTLLIRVKIHASFASFAFADRAKQFVLADPTSLFRVHHTRRALLAPGLRVHLFHLTLLTLLIRVKNHASFASFALGFRVHHTRRALLALRFQIVARLALVTGSPGVRCGACAAEARTTVAWHPRALATVFAWRISTSLIRSLAKGLHRTKCSRQAVAKPRI
eukprot:COSAG05_NODE_1627_length_4376_cov_3.480945_4_plen_224_part_00